MKNQFDVKAKDAQPMVEIGQGQILKFENSIME
jgi:hypothetical protein